MPTPPPRGRPRRARTAAELRATQAWRCAIERWAKVLGRMATGRSDATWSALAAVAVLAPRCDGEASAPWLAALQSPLARQALAQYAKIATEPGKVRTDWLPAVVRDELARFERWARGRGHETARVRAALRRIVEPLDVARRAPLELTLTELGLGRVLELVTLGVQRERLLLDRPPARQRAQSLFPPSENLGQRPGRGPAAGSR